MGRRLADRAQVTAEHHRAAVDDGDVVADVLDEIELMAREHHCDSGGCLFPDDPAHGVCPHWVQPRERLVEDQQLGAVHQGGGKLHPLLVAVRELLETISGTTR